jgi:hypothetical protein
LFPVPSHVSKASLFRKNAPTGAFFVKIYAARETPAAAVGKYILKQIKKTVQSHLAAQEKKTKSLTNWYFDMLLVHVLKADSCIWEVVLFANQE